LDILPLGRTGSLNQPVDISLNSYIRFLILNVCEATSGRNRSWNDGLQKCSFCKNAPKEKSQDFSTEVAAQTAAKPATNLVKEEPAATEAKETEPK
jgi:hypothetical protein